MRHLRRIFSWATEARYEVNGDRFWLHIPSTLVPVSRITKTTITPTGIQIVGRLKKSETLYIDAKSPTEHQCAYSSPAGEAVHRLYNPEWKLEESSQSFVCCPKK